MRSETETPRVEVSTSSMLAGWGHRLRAGPSHLWQLYNDWRLNVDTMPDGAAPMVPEPFERDGRPDYRAHYQSANYLYLQQIARIIRPVPNQLTLYDLGCGKGRALCVMARLPFKKVVGVDLSEELCEAARQNAARMSGRVAPVEIVCADATAADASNGHVYFLFNPFGAPTLQAVLENIEQSLGKAPRSVTFVYYHAVHESVLEAAGWLEPYYVLPTLSGLRVSFWRNTRGLTRAG